MPQPNPPEPPRSLGRTVYKWVVLALKVVAVLTLLGDFVLYIITIKGAVHSDSFNAYEKAFELLSSVGFMMMLIMQGIGEIGPEWYLSRVTFMRIMGVRGLLYIWQGIQAVGNSTSDAAKAVTDISPATLKVFGDIVGWSMMAAGLLIGALSLFRVKSAIALYEEEAGYNDASKPALSDIDKERQKAAQPAQGKQLLSPEARTVISNMAIALDITSSKAWDLFNGPAGAEEARRLRTERAQALALNASDSRNQNSKPSMYDSGPPPPPPGKAAQTNGANPVTHSAAPAPPTTANDTNRSARLLSDDDALAAAYYGTTAGR